MDHGLSNIQSGSPDTTIPRLRAKGPPIAIETVPLQADTLKLYILDNGDFKCCDGSFIPRGLVFCFPGNSTKLFYYHLAYMWCINDW